VRDLSRFRDAVRVHRRIAGRTQQQLARAIGLHPDVLSHKMNASDSAVLTGDDVVAIVTVLADWGVLASRAEAEQLLALMAVPPQAIPAQAWLVPPLASLRADTPPTRSAPPPPPAPHTAGPASVPPVGMTSATEPDGSHARLTVAPLPAQATALIGRERELVAVAVALESSRLVTLTGVGGTGKTRLALRAGSEVADRFADGAAFVDLAPVNDPDLLATAIAGALGLAPPSAGAAEGRLTGALADRELLLILDNLEQLLEGVPLIARILTAAPALRILATSRIALRLYGEHTLRVPPLHLPGEDAGPAGRDTEAVRLFIERARAVRPDFRPDDDLADVAAICTVLDGLPLAIELAAARTRLYPPKALLSLLESRLALLTGGARDLPQRQQTLRAALDWSYDLLSDAERHLFACLGSFSGPFDAAAAGSVSGENDQGAVLQGLAELADHSMIEVIPGTTPRFQLLQTVREYALARLAEAGTQDKVRLRHLDYYLAMAEAARSSLTWAEQSVTLDLLQAAYPNVRAALEFACRQAELDGSCLETGMRLATAVRPLWRRRGPLAEGELYLRRLLARDDARHRAASPQIRAAAALDACALACFSGDYERGAELGRDCVALLEPAGDNHGLTAAHRFLGEAALAVGELGAAEDHFRQAITAAERAGSTHDRAAAVNMLGQLCRHTGDHSRSRQLTRQAVRLFRDSGDLESAAFSLHSLAETERDLGRVALAERLFAMALRQHDALGSKRGIAYDLEGLAGIACLADAGRRALAYLGAAQQLRDGLGAPLAPVERDSLDQICGPALAGIPAHEQAEALSRGRNQPLADVIASALQQTRSAWE
jgi:predicted ATPase